MWVLMMQNWQNKMSRYIPLLGSLLACSLHADDMGMKTSAAVDIVGATKISKESDASDRLDVRAAELLLYGPIDPTFDGLLSIAAHQEAEGSFFEFHEAYIASSKLIPRSQVRVGQFFLNIGRLNSVHRHEWPFISAPKVHEQFFGAEGVADSGLEYSYLAPLPFFLDLSFGLTNGWVYGHSHNQGAKPRQPIRYARAGSYVSLFANGGAKTGFNYLERRAADGENMTLVGLDLVAKWRAQQTLLFLLQSEAWFRTKQALHGDKEQSLGAYVYPQHALREDLFFGSRFDYYSILTLKDVTNKDIDNATYAIVPTLTYKASEFATLRIAYNYEWSKMASQEDKQNQKLEMQATFIMGAHPAHDF